MLRGTKCAGKSTFGWLIQDIYRGCKTVVRSAQCGRGEQLSDYTKALKPIPVPTPDGCVDRGCDKGRIWINDFCR